MNRAECQAMITEKMLEIKDIYEKYRPDGDYLSLTICDGTIMFWNRYYDVDADMPIDCYVKLDKTEEDELLEVQEAYEQEDEADE